ncbi:MAG TPA: hypothetical protein VF543_15400 [Pyrinomonadaceae bacterium]|jgi:hypothetical protein
MNRLEVKTSKLQLVLAVLLGCFFVPLGLLNLGSGFLKGLAIVPLGLGFMMLASFGVIIWLVRRGHAKSVKYFSEEGLVRNNGRGFSWAELDRVVDQIRMSHRSGNTKFIWRTEIQFKNGDAAWLIPAKVSNFREVSAYVSKLPCEHKEIMV